jgi:hypothetical protein
MADGSNLTIANTILKTVYGDINEQINNATPALDGIKSSARNITQVGGLGIKFVAHTGRNTGLGARGEDELLPDAGQQQYQSGTASLKSFYGTVRLTGQVMAQASANYQTFADVTSEEIERIRDDIAKDQNRQVFGDGTGIIATVATTTGAPTSYTTSSTLTVDDAKYIQLGMRVDLVVSKIHPTNLTVNGTAGQYIAPVAGQAYATVTNVNKATKVVTLDKTFTLSSGQVTAGVSIVRSNTTASGILNNYGKEWTGFGAMIDDSTSLHGIDPSTVPSWKAVVKDISTGSAPNKVMTQVTETDMISVVTQIAAEGDKPDVIWCDHGTWNGYWKTLQDRRRFVNKVDLDGGNRGLGFVTEFGDLPLKADFDAPANKMFFVNSKKINLNTSRGWEWIDEDGSKWKQIPFKDAFVAYLRSYSELSTYRRNTHGLLKGILPVAN